MKRSLQVIVALLVVLAGALLTCGCDDSQSAETLHAAIQTAKKTPDELVVVKCIAKERIPDAKGIYSFFRVEEPSGRDFVVQTVEKLNFGKEYRLSGRIVPWPSGYKSTRELFLVDGTASSFPWLLLVGTIGVLTLAGLGSKFRKEIGGLFNKAVIPKYEEGTSIYGGKQAHAVSTSYSGEVPSLYVTSDSNQSGTQHNAFIVPFNESDSVLDPARDIPCTRYSFGRSEEENHYILLPNYIKRVSHFFVNSYEDRITMVEVNPAAKTPIIVSDEAGRVLPISAGHPQTLLNGYTIKIGEIKLRFSAPSSRK